MSLGPLHVVGWIGALSKSWRRSGFREEFFDADCAMFFPALGTSLPGRGVVTILSDNGRFEVISPTASSRAARIEWRVFAGGQEG